MVLSNEFSSFSLSLIITLKCLLKLNKCFKAADSHNYVNSVSLANSNGGSSCTQTQQVQSSSSRRDYVNQPPLSGAHFHHHNHQHSSQQSRDNAAHQKHRRTQKRITHNEKRYHSGNDLTGIEKQFKHDDHWTFRCFIKFY